MKNLMTKFLNDESGAVSAEWVVLTAAIVFLATAVGWLIHDDAVASSEIIGQHMTNEASL